MGTDIHLGVERRNNGKWEALTEVFPEREQVRLAYENHEAPESIALFNEYPLHRSYDLFAMLADVRNGTGFAGVVRCDKVEPCFPNRGIPEDTCFPEEDEHWLGGYHSFTWCTYDEALNAPWTREVITDGVLAFDEWVDWKKAVDAIPTRWSGGVGGGGTRMVSEEEAVKIHKSGESTSGVHVKARWRWKPLADSSFRQWLLSTKFQEAANQYGGENIRICISFDS